MPKTSCRKLLLILPALALVLNAKGASAQVQCAEVETCFCAPAGATDGIYLGRVLGGGGSGGTQVQIIQTIVQDNDLDPGDRDIDERVFFGVNEPAGTEIFVSSRGYVAIESGGQNVRCGSSSPGATLFVSRSSAQRLITAPSCIAELNSVDISGIYPECIDGGAGAVLCAATSVGDSGHSPTAAALACLIFASIYRRRRSNAWIQ